jgi:hypothetical protein
MEVSLGYSKPYSKLGEVEFRLECGRAPEKRVLLTLCRQCRHVHACFPSVTLIGAFAGKSRPFERPRDVFVAQPARIWRA